MLLVCSCSHKQSNTIERLAIVPANVLISDPSSEWMSLGIALALEQDLSTSQHLEAILTSGESGAYQGSANQVLRTTVENRNGRIRIEGTITHLSTQRNVRVINVEGPASVGVLSDVNTLAKHIDPQAAAFSTKSDRAWQAYTQAAGSSDLRARIDMLRTAVTADPAFGLAYLVLAEVAQAGGQSAAPIIADAERHRDSFTPLDKVRLDALVSRTSHASLAEQAKATAAVLSITPNDIDMLTTLGSERFLEGDASNGARLMNRALDLSPGNVNIRAQLAEGLLETRQFAEAEKLFTGLDNNQAVLPELALCILLEGDTARANSVFSKYLQQRAAANDTLLFLAQANWIAVSKQPGEGVQFLAKNRFSNDDLRSLALSQSTVWQLFGKDSAGAKKSAASALELAKAPVPKFFANVAVLLAGGDSNAGDWRERVNASPLQDSIKHAVLAYGFYLNARYPEAVEEWQKLVQQSGNADLRARAMLAASLDRAGRGGEARKIAVQPFTPNLTGADQFAVVTFNEMRRLLSLRMH